MWLLPSIWWEQRWSIIVDRGALSHWVTVSLSLTESLSVCHSLSHWLHSESVGVWQMTWHCRFTHSIDRLHFLWATPPLDFLCPTPPAPRLSLRQQSTAAGTQVTQPNSQSSEVTESTEEISHSHTDSHILVPSDDCYIYSTIIITSSSSYYWSLY